MDFDNTNNLKNELKHIAEHLEKCEEINLENYIEYNYEVRGDDKLGVHGKYLTISRLISGLNEQIRAINMLVGCIEMDFAKLNKKE